MRVLILEDELDLRRLLAEMLCDEGYSVDVAADGADGLTKAKFQPYDAIVLDVLLPKKNGWEVLRELRTTHRTPVLILSARDSLPDRVRGLDLGADDYLVKPFERAELLARLRALIRRSAGQAESVIAWADLVLDVRGKTVLRGGAPVALTAKEFALLEYLAVHRGRVIGRIELYDHLFDQTDDVLSNLLDVHVSNVRKKLGSDTIVTRRGQGYVIP